MHVIAGKKGKIALDVRIHEEVCGAMQQIFHSA